MIMRTAGRLSRLLCALHTQQVGGRCLEALPPPQTAVSGCVALQQTAAACRSASWTARSLPVHWINESVRALSTASGAEDGPLKQFNLAQLGEGIKECELVQWFVAEGDEVEEFGQVCQVQHDKATVDITSPYAGTVKKLYHAAGDIVQVGDVLADILAKGDGPLELHAPPVEAETASSSSCGSGSSVVEHAPHTADREAHHPSSSGSIGADEVADRVLTSPAVRRIAREENVPLHKVKGTGPEGRVTKGDVLAYLDAINSAGPGTVAEEIAARIPTTEEATVAGIPPESAHVAQAMPPRPAAPTPEAAAAAKAAADLVLAPVVVPLKGFRKAMVKSMTAAAQVPHFHYCDEVQMDALVELRQRLKGDPALSGTKLTYMPFFLKAAALAMREFPNVNASLSADQASVLQHRRANIGVAMATPHGLAVPNIKDVQDKTVLELAQELNRLQAAAGANKLSLEDISGGTFSLSNIGTIGGTYACPLVNPPEVAIMAVGSMQQLPRFAPDGRTVVPASIINLSLGADHRVVDGATLAGFARSWRHYIESPGMLLLHMK